MHNDVMHKNASTILDGRLVTKYVVMGISNTRDTRRAGSPGHLAGNRG